MTDPIPTPAPTLSARLRAVSFGGHEQPAPIADPAPSYYDAFLDGELSPHGVGAQVAQHYLMYEALEAATDAHARRHGPGFPFDFPELRRMEALRADMAYWFGPGWRDHLEATPYIAEYVARINAVCPDSLPHLIAHHYTRYLGDLSGGQMIGRRFARSYGLDTEDGRRFYLFPEIPDARAFKDGYRVLLDGLDLTEAEILLIEDEVRLGYTLNNNAVRDLDARLDTYRA
ncbi:heme oxygenase [Mycetocola sp. BIGb0189]|uniref:biliverdin-producing heme oxygenase n=1 Tax=Mycetocola sp. BIGb0189 TaxID=2940604 RepID=UPI002166E8F0|nr:biliverdin-producing heme oxygenase [Mycetocola sp. BIGb0189]MCS4277872.1 heme oxygenase [Mycetocola sp. BIGb0189]